MDFVKLWKPKVEQISFQRPFCNKECFVSGTYLRIQKRLCISRGTSSRIHGTACLYTLFIKNQAAQNFVRPA